MLCSVISFLYCHFFSYIHAYHLYRVLCPQNNYKKAQEIIIIIITMYEEQLQGRV